MTQQFHSYFDILKITKNRRANKTVYMNVHNSLTARSKHLKMEVTVTWTVSERRAAGWVFVSCTSPGASMARDKGLEECSLEPMAPALRSFRLTMHVLGRSCP